jgi:hypothetical protein
LNIALTRGEHRRAIGFDDGDEPQNYCRKEKLPNFPPYYRGAKFFNRLKAEDRCKWMISYFMNTA